MAQPLPAGNLKVGTGWRYSKGGIHAAFDYPVVIGTPVFAVADGVVLDCHDGVSNKPKQVTGAPSNWVLLGGSPMPARRRLCCTSTCRRDSV